MGFTLGKNIADSLWGCEHSQVFSAQSDVDVKLCHVSVSNLASLATELARKVQDTSWIIDLDVGAQRSYKVTAKETADALLEIFNNISLSSTKKVAGDFGELMVSIGSSRALELVFEHASLPIAELWKPQAKQNEGFDFHTICSESRVNFGEAKFSSITNPYTDALVQIDEFLRKEKHYRDRVHLVNFVSKDAINKLDKEDFGVVAAFSITSQNPMRIYQKALDRILGLSCVESVSSIYLVGVSH